jgi:hypothetical protein
LTENTEAKKIYDEAIARANETYQKALTKTNQEYDQAKAPIWRAYLVTMEPIKAIREEQIEDAQEALDKAEAEALAAYKEATGERTATKV